MKKVLIVGASALQIPAILKAKELGYCVAAADYDPRAVGIKYADKYYNASTIDPEAIYNAAKDFKADGIATVATDMPMRAIAYACEKLGLTGISYDTALKATDKALMIKAFEEHNVPHPWYFVVDGEISIETKSRLTYPCICKPTDNSGSRGVNVIHNEEELNEAIGYSSKNGRSGTVIVEELLIGSEISVEAFAVDGEVTVVAITDKLTTGSPHFVEMGHSQPSKFEGEVKEQIIKAAAGAMKAVGIENGPAHVEMMVTENGPRLIELGARLGGDFITTDLVPLSTGVDILGAVINLACNEPVDINRKFNKASAVRFMQSKTGTLSAIRGIEEAAAVKGVIRVGVTKKIGDKIGDIENSLDRPGYAIAQADSVPEAVKCCEEALSKVEIMVE